MNICNDNHSEIIYDSRECPLCKAYKEIEYLEEDIERLTEQSERLELE